MRSVCTSRTRNSSFRTARPSSSNGRCAHRGAYGEGDVLHRASSVRACGHPPLQLHPSFEVVHRQFRRSKLDHAERNGIKRDPLSRRQKNICLKKILQGSDRKDQGNEVTVMKKFADCEVKIMKRFAGSSIFWGVCSYAQPCS